jgi:UDP-N-acetylglucosamine 2-epimerase (non-hydrolysing)
MPVVFPMHPRTRKAIEKFKLDTLLDFPQLIILEPLNYLSFLGLMKDATLVLTDSGGIQEETTALGIPCFTLRNNTERPITITAGTNTLVGTEPKKITEAFNDFLNGNIDKKVGSIPTCWDGHAAERICNEIIKWLISKRNQSNNIINFNV